MALGFPRLPSTTLIKNGNNKSSSQTNVQTTPRKRRPRIADEVFISSDSNVYLNYSDDVPDGNRSRSLEVVPTHQTRTATNLKYENLPFNGSNGVIDQINVTITNHRSRSSVIGDNECRNDASQFTFCRTTSAIDVTKKNKLQTAIRLVDSDKMMEHQQAVAFIDDRTTTVEDVYDKRINEPVDDQQRKTNQTVDDDSYDSFDSDDTDEETDKKGELIYGKLPEPPPSTNQVYALMKKFKKIGTLPSMLLSKKKSKYSTVAVDSKPSKKSIKSNGKLSSKTQFYVGENFYANTTPSAAVNNNSKRDDDDDIYDTIDITNRQPTSQSMIRSVSTSAIKQQKSKSTRSSKFYVDSDNNGMEPITSDLPNHRNSAPTTISPIRKSLPLRTRRLPPPPPPPKPTNIPPPRIPRIILPRPLKPTPIHQAINVQAVKTINYADIKDSFELSWSDKIDSPVIDKSRNGSTTSWYGTDDAYSSVSGSTVSNGSGRLSKTVEWHCLFDNEPLYQIYSAEKVESLSADMEDVDDDVYEAIDDALSDKKQLRPTALQLVGPKQGPSRTLWSEIPEVIESNILSTISSPIKRLQEAKFEILTSEASYLKSLTLLRTHFINNPLLKDPAGLLSNDDRSILFSHILLVHECSGRLLGDLERCWQDSILLKGISDKLYENVEKYFKVYVAYCEDQFKMDRKLKSLKESKSSLFNQLIDKLEADPVCCGLSLHSFLMLPMQRITRMPLLIDAVFGRLLPDDEEYASWKRTLALLNKVVSECNVAATRTEQAYEMNQIAQQIEFPSNIRALPIIPVGITAPGKKPRHLVRRGELIQLVWRGDDGKLTFGKKFTKIPMYAFLFTDLMVLTKKKHNDETFTVVDYCWRPLLTISASEEVMPQLPFKDLSNVKHLLIMTLLENHAGKMVEMMISCTSETEKQRWIQATTPPKSDNPNEKLYDLWDCPQVLVKFPYVPLQPDELALEPGDIVNITNKMTDGWYQGERIRDGAIGWFPANRTIEVSSTHVRARNLKQQNRLLTYTTAYCDSLLSAARNDKVYKV